MGRERSVFHRGPESFHSNEGRIHLRRPTLSFSFSLAIRRRTIHVWIFEARTVMFIGEHSPKPDIPLDALTMTKSVRPLTFTGRTSVMRMSFGASARSGSLLANAAAAAVPAQRMTERRVEVMMFWVGVYNRRTADMPVRGHTTSRKKRNYSGLNGLTPPERFPARSAFDERARA
jgi:hypothetical protein